MIQWTKDKQLLLFIIPVTAQAPKNRGAIIERVCRDPNLCFRVGDNRTFKICISWQIHRSASKIRFKDIFDSNGIIPQRLDQSPAGRSEVIGEKDAALDNHMFYYYNLFRWISN